MFQKRSYFKANRVGLYEPSHNITNNLHIPKTKAQISCAVTCFRYTGSTIPYPSSQIQNFKLLVFSCDCAGQFVSNLDFFFFLSFFLSFSFFFLFFFFFFFFFLSFFHAKCVIA